MTPFIILFILTIIVGLRLDDTEYSRKFFCVFTGILFFLLAMLRSENVGVDTEDYVWMFNRITTWSMAITKSNSNKDPVFGGFLFVVKKIYDNYTFLFAIVAAWYTSITWRFIYKHSFDPLLSVILLLSFNLYQFSLTGMRQTIAMGFILLSVDLIIEKKYKSGSILILTSALFHKSSLLALIILPISMLKREMTKTKAFFIALAMGLVFILRSYLAQILILLIQDRDYSIQNDNGGMIMLLVFVALFFMIVFFINDTSQIDEKSVFFLYISAVALFFEFFVPIQAVFFRLAFYFLFGYVILVPNTIYSQNDYKFRKVINIIIYCLMSIQYLFFTISSSGVVPYEFFWEV